MTTSLHPALLDLIIPGTDPDVIARYATLASRAPSFEAGLFEEDVVIVDTETTGVDPASCELIQVAAARMRGPEIVERFDSFCRPIRPIPPEIVELTGITDAMVADAPESWAVVEQLASFVAGAPLVAHNASFDRAVLERAARTTGVHLMDTWYDTLPLARIALPRLRSHALMPLAAAFELDGATHRADDDVTALAGLWRIILLALSELPPGLMNRLADLHPSVQWGIRPIFRMLAGRTPDTTFSLLASRKDRIARIEAEPRPDAEDMGALRTLSHEDVDVAFAPGGVVSRMYEGYEPRPEQAQMARVVVDAFEKDAFAVIEAGTGVGKSIAYLVPAVALAQENRVTVGVATKTNALMDQLVHHELPALARVMDEPLRWAALKGYEHYPCMRKLDILVHGDKDMDDEQLSTIAILLAFSAETRDGDLDAAPVYWHALHKSAAVSTSAECVKRFCPYYPRSCFVHGARQRANTADIVVTNHSLLFRDVATDGALLPPLRHLVIDEAHTAEREAREQWALSVSLPELSAVMDVLGARRSGVLARLFEASKKTEGGPVLAAATARAQQALEPLAALVPSFFSFVKELGEVEGDAAYDRATLWIDPQVRESGTWGMLSRTGASLEQKLEQLLSRLDGIRDLCEDVSADVRSDLAGATSRLRSAHMALKLVLDGSDDRYCFSAHLDRRENRGVETLTAARIDIGEAFIEELYPETRSIVFTSATIAVGEKFDHFLAGTGLDRVDPERVMTARIPSGYDYDSNMSVIVPPDMPDPRSPAYLGALEELLFHTHVGMGGSTLTLFTNRREMEAMYRVLKPRLAAEGLSLACQTRGTSAKRLRERFIEDETSSLLALRTFWEGFDAGGDTLRCVVIAKLPFPLPTDPLAKERELRIQGAWGKFTLPEAVLTVKQAAGRLIRSSTDRGCLVIADSRVLSKRYGSRFLKSLPKVEHDAVPIGDVADYLASWREGRDA